MTLPAFCNGPPVIASDGAEYRIAFAGPSALADLARGPLPALLDDLFQTGALLRCHFQRKPPGLRLRLAWVRRPDPDPVLALLHLLHAACPAAFDPPVVAAPYREVALFGGTAALDWVETFFDADSRMVLRLAAAPSLATPPLAVSALVLDALFRAAAADPWEMWSMWQDLATLRGGPSAAPVLPEPLVSSPACVAAAALAARRCAAGLRELAQTGDLSVSLRSVIPIIAAFHLNRMGFDAATQSALATGAALALSCFPADRAVPADLAPVAFQRVALGPASVFDQPDLDRAIRAGDLAAWQARAAHVEHDTLRQAVDGPLRPVLHYGKASSRLADDVPRLLSRPPAPRRKHDRRTLDTVLNLVWRHCGNPVPYADLAATRLFDPRHPDQPADVCQSATIRPDSPFAADRLDPRPAGPMPSGWSAALSVAAQAFSRADAPVPAPSQVALSLLLDRIGKGRPLTLWAADQALAELAQQSGLPAPLRDPVLLAHALGLRLPDWPALPGPASGPLPDLCPPPAPALPPDAPPRRVALRLQPVPDGLRLNFLGTDRMCWLARYLPRGHAMERPLRQAAAGWLARWPEVVDATAGFSRHPLDAHEPLTLHAASLAPERHWLQRQSNGLYDLTDAEGRPLHAVHFGVSSPAALAPAARLALCCGARLPAWGEWVVAAMNRHILGQMQQADTAALCVQGLRIGTHLLLPGCACLLSAQNPALGPALPDDPRRLWDLLCATGGPALLGPVTVRRVPGPEMRVLDLRFPTGLRTLARMAGRPGARWLMIDPLPRDADDRPAAEYYIELAAPPAGPPGPRIATWIPQPRWTSSG